MDNTHLINLMEKEKVNEAVDYLNSELKKSDADRAQLNIRLSDVYLHIDIKKSVEFLEESFIYSSFISKKNRMRLIIKYCMRLNDLDLRRNWEKIEFLLHQSLEENQEYVSPRAQSLLILSENYFLRRDFDNYDKYINTTKEFILQNEFEDKDELYSYLLYIEASYYLRNDLQISKKSILKAMNLTNDSYYLFRYKLQYSRNFFLEDLNKSISIVKNLLKQLNDSNLIKEYHHPWKDIELECYFTLSYYYYSQRDYQKALDYIKKSYKLSKNTNSIEMIGECLMFQTMILAQLNDYEVFLRVKQKALNYCKKMKYKDLIVDIKGIKFYNATNI